MQLITMGLLVIAASIVSSYYHAVFTGDSVAAYFGYFISMGVLPALVGGVIGCVGIYALCKNITANIKTFWWLPALGSTASLAPTLLYIVAMSAPH